MVSPRERGRYQGLIGAVFGVSARHAAEPVIPLRLFRDQAFRIAAAISLITGIAMFGAISYLPTYLQIVTGVSATTSGLLLPLIGGLLVTSIASGRLITRTGHYKAYPVAGTALAAAGLYLLSTMDVRTSYLASSVYLLVLGLGLGLFMQVMVLSPQNSAAQRDPGTATASVNFARQIGSSIGVALIGALFIHQLGAHLPASAAGHLSAAQVSSITPQGLAQLPAPLRHVIAQTFAHALPTIYAYLIPLLAVAFVLALILKEIPLRTRAGVMRHRPPPRSREHAPRVPQPPALARPAAGWPRRKLRPHPPRCAAPDCLTAGITRLPSEPRMSTNRISR